MYSPELDTALSYWEALDCAESLSLAIKLRYNDFDGIATSSCDPRSYANADRYRLAACAIGFLAQYPHLKTSFDRKAVAREKWFKAEYQCKRTNLQLEPFLRLLNGGADDDDFNEVALLPFIKEARRKIASWIGHKPRDVFEGRFGPGSTRSDPARLTSVPDKMSSVPTYTHSAWPYLFPWSGTNWAKSVLDINRYPKPIRGNKHTTVSKNAKTERSIGIEPSINIYYQLTLGGQLRECLRRIGIDLTYGKELHMSLAREGSLHGFWATLDLSSASDTVCKNLVKLLLPRLWYDALCDLRSPFTEINGKQVYLEKFSSMGNGYTFELETLIFLALSCTMVPTMVPGHDVFVFGDDIIIPEQECSKVVSVLTYFGFTLNNEKSFQSGDFKESCGGDYFQGVGVRPYYLKKDLDEPQNVISIANGIRGIIEQSAQGSPLRSRLIRCWHRVLDLLPVHIRACRGPKELGDLVIHDNESRWTYRVRNSRRYFRCYRPATYRKVSWKWFTPEVKLATALYLIQGPLSATVWRTPALGHCCQVSHVQLRTGSESFRWVRRNPEQLRNPMPEEHSRYLVPRDGVEGYKIGWTQFS